MPSATGLAANQLNASKPDAPADLADRSGPLFAGSFAGSQGARTPERNARSARNAAEFAAGFRLELAPATATEHTFAAVALNAAWRLRRCDRIEANLSAKAYEKGVDPLEDDDTARTLNSVDRARTQAAATLRRALHDLRQLQTERRLRAELFPATQDTAAFGLADHRVVVSTLARESRRRRAEDRAASPTLEAFQAIVDKTNPGLAGHPAAPCTAEFTKRSQSLSAGVPDACHRQPFIAEFTKRTQRLPPEMRSLLTTMSGWNTGAPGRNAPCPCRSGRKYKRCCGLNAPAMPGSHPMEWAA